MFCLIRWTFWVFQPFFVDCDGFFDFSAFYFLLQPADEQFLTNASEEKIEAQRICKQEMTPPQKTTGTPVNRKFCLRSTVARKDNVARKRNVVRFQPNRPKLTMQKACFSCEFEAFSSKKFAARSSIFDNFRSKISELAFLLSTFPIFCVLHALLSYRNTLYSSELIKFFHLDNHRIISACSKFRIIPVYDLMTIDNLMTQTVLSLVFLVFVAIVGVNF